MGFSTSSVKGIDIPGDRIWFPASLFALADLRIDLNHSYLLVCRQVRWLEKKTQRGVESLHTNRGDVIGHVERFGQVLRPGNRPVDGNQPQPLAL